MPTYEYACGACGHEWEQAQRITEAPIETCPKCAAAAAHRLISGGTNFILKGGGWYSDLYASPKAGAKKSEGGSSPESPASPKSETKSEGSGGTSEGSGKSEGSTSDSSKSSASSTPSTTAAASSS
jgi:putative FmdB family regulatory protein